MRSFMLGAAAIALVTFPAMAETSLSHTSSPRTSSPGEMPQTTSPNSGAKVEGDAGNKNGPPASSETTGAGADANNAQKTPQDVSKVPGLPGNKSGPSVRRPSEANTSTSK
ncbi:hypothetical protein RA307_13865 [Xanthobacteraceae bacterium Astr-EGSB]|uniref:hypothetical protein n=1 Tax=Astrobacterium formosum TaxID=3069710 RepID=UPI0027AFC372|nr:hypothetical protein [Xanthobacteraceae bacterium Astr-EGSB]